MNNRLPMIIIISLLVPLAVIVYILHQRIIHIDGQWIAYYCAIMRGDGGFHSNDSAIMLTSIDQEHSTKQLIRTSSRNHVNNPNWLSSNQIAFELGFKIYIWNLESGSNKPIRPNSTGIESFPVGSPNGNSIAYVSGLEALYLYNLETAETDKLITLENPTRPSWSPDGRFIALDQSNKIILFDVQNRTPSTLIEFDQNLLNGTSWSPDGQYIAFSGNIRGTWGLYRIHISTLEIDLISQGMTSFPAWSPDGNWIAFNADFNIYRIQPDGTNRQSIETPKECATVGAVAWSHQFE